MNWWNFHEIISPQYPKKHRNLKINSPKPEFSVVWSGRLGNLLFQYASMMGICSRSMKYYESVSHNDVATCLKISNPNYYSLDNPVSEFVKMFNLSASTRKFPLTNTYHEHAEDRYGIFFDEKVFLQPNGTEFQGYFQSWRYFHPFAETVIRRTLVFDKEIENYAQSFIFNIRKKCMTPNCKLIGVQVRIGDKLNNINYDQWSLGEHYFCRAMTLLAHRFRGHHEIHYIFFIGGGFSERDQKRDVQWTHRMLATTTCCNYNHINSNHSHSVSFATSAITNKTDMKFYFEESGNYANAMRALSLCDALVVGQSSFGWWAAYFFQSNLKSNRLVVAPKDTLPVGPRLPKFVAEDYFLPDWITLSQKDTIMQDRI
mmetsp:Transcript_7193/g.10710  ORF Transcript_7193/g.10710 Transcript_7193/m.10710 type:complete len:372 (+) Transcript_7193:70-1185(+)